MPRPIGTTGTAPASKPPPQPSVGPPILPAPRNWQAASQARQNTPAPYHANVPAKPVTAKSYAVFQAPKGTPAAAQQAAAENQAALERVLLRALQSPIGGRGFSFSAHAGDVPSHNDGGFLSAISGIPLLGGAIHLGASAAGTLGHLALNTGKDALSLPGATLSGVESLGSAALDDILHGQLGSLNYSSRILPSGQHSETAQLASQMWHQSVIGHLARGDISGAVHTFAQHPLYGASEFAGAYGLLGRGAGALARSGALGDRAAAVADTARAGRELAPGITPDVQHYSPNLATKVVQQAIEKRPGLQKAVDTVAGRSPIRMLKKRVDERVAVNAAREQAMVLDHAKVLKQEMPHGPAAAIVSRGVQGLVDQHNLVNQLRQEHIDLQAAQAAHESAALHGLGPDHGLMTPEALAANVAHQTAIEKFLEHPDVQAVFSTTYAQRSAQLDQALGKLGLRDAAQMERRVLMPYVEKRMPEARFVEPGSVPTPRAIEAQAAAKDILDSRRALNEAKLNHVKLTNMSGDAERAVAQAERAAAKADKQHARTESFTTGRYGLARVNYYRNGAPGDSARLGLPAEQGGRLDANFLRSYGSRDALQQARELQRAEKAARRDAGKAGIAAAKDNLKASLDEYRQVHKPYRNEKYSGSLMVHDPRAPLIRAGKFKGQQLRPLTNDEITAHMRANGVNPNDLGYVRLNTPMESNRVVPTFLRRGGSKSKRLTGASLKKGTWTPGYGALGKTEIGRTQQLARAMAHDDLISESAIRDTTGRVQEYNKTTAPLAAERYSTQHGVDVVAIPRHPGAIGDYQQAIIRSEQNGTPLSEELQRVTEQNGRGDRNLVLVPKVMIDRYLAHQKVNETSSSLLMKANRQFRNTVLPLSPKWLTGNVAEAGLRAAIKGAGPRDFALAGRVISRMREMGLNSEADHLERLSTGGLHYGMQHRMNMEQIGVHAPEARGLIRTVASKALHSYTTAIVEPVFKFNRVLESSAEKAVLGAHMSRQMQEFAGTWARTVTHQRDYIDALAKGYADPRLAADAGRFVHQTLGQYDRFSPGMKRFVRSIAPFAPWYVNSLKFMYHTLPLGHPLLQSALLDAQRPVAEQWAKDHNVPHNTLFKGLGEGDLLTALRTGKNDYLNLGRYTPAGAFTSGPTDYGLNALVPQLQSSWHALNGQDPFGNDLTDKHGKVTSDGRRLLIALNDMFGELGGPDEVLSRIIGQHGNTAYNASMPAFWDNILKANTHHGPAGLLGGLNRVLNPFEPTHLGPAKAKKGGRGAFGGSAFGGSKKSSAFGKGAF